MTKSILTLIALISLSLSTVTVHANDVTIVLKNGSTMKGTIISESGNFLSITNNGSKVNVLKSIIATIDGKPYSADDQPAPSQPAEAAPEPAAAADAGGTQVEITMQDGSTIKGVLITENANFMTINTGSAEVKILKSNIAGSKRSTTTLTSAPSKPVTSGAAPIPRPATPSVEQPAAPVIAKPQAPAHNQPNTTEVEHSVVLKNGTQFKGPVITESANFITFSINGSKVNILKSIISAFDGAPYPPTQTALAPAAVPQTPAPAPADAYPLVSAPAATAKTAAASPATAAVPTPAAPSRPTVVPVEKPAPVQAPVQAPPTNTANTVKYGPTAPLIPAGNNKQSSEAFVQAPPAGSATTIPSKTSNAPAVPAKPAVQKAEQTATLPPPSPQVQEQTKKLAAQERDKQIQAAMQLKSMGPSAASAVPQLIEMLGSEVRPLDIKEGAAKKSKKPAAGSMTPAKAATEALISIGAASIEPLIGALSIRNYGVRANACYALGELKDARSVDGLFIALKDSFAEVRANASEALGKIRDPRAIPLLVTILGEDISEDVRNATQVSLNNLTDIPTLIATLKDPSKLVRENVAYILFLMTAKDFRADPSQWEIWWKEQQDGEKK